MQVIQNLLYNYINVLENLTIYKQIVLLIQLIFRLIQKLMIQQILNNIGQQVQL